MTPELTPRDRIAIERLVDEAAAETVSPQGCAYEKALGTLNTAIREHDRFKEQAAHERWRRLRAERDKVYAQQWCGILLGVIAALVIALAITGGAR